MIESTNTDERHGHPAERPPAEAVGRPPRYPVEAVINGRRCTLWEDRLSTTTL